MPEAEMLPPKSLYVCRDQTGKQRQKADNDRQKHPHDVNFLTFPKKPVERIHFTTLDNLDMPNHSGIKRNQVCRKKNQCDTSYNHHYQPDKFRVLLVQTEVEKGVSRPVDDGVDKPHQYRYFHNN